MGSIYSWIFWAAAAAMLFGLAVATVRYVWNVRQGARTMASVDLVKVAMAAFGLAALWLLDQAYS